MVQSPAHYAGIIFDFNGVLWWDEELQIEAWQAAARRLRGGELSQAEILQYCLGVPNQLSLEYLVGRPLGAEEAHRLTQEKEADYRALCLAQGEAFRLSPGAVELLDWLAARGIPRTIATSSESVNVAFFSEHLHLARWFDLEKIIYDDGHLPGKPSPQVYLRAAAVLGLPPRRCVVVEDSLSGLAAAQAAGIGRVYALGPTEVHERLRSQPGVDGLLVSLADLPAEALFGEARPGSNSGHP
jgi:HAD superfamily hydrolase (TIGR01509 family)